MKSFPSTLNKGGSKLNQPNASTSVKDALVNSFKNAFNSAVTSTTSGRNFDTDGIKYSVDQDKKALINEIKNNNNFTTSNDLIYGNNKLFVQDNPILVENPFHMDQSLFNIINNYRSATGPNDVLIETGNDNPEKEDNQRFITNNFIGRTSHSLFNPYFGVNVNGIARNVPLLDGGKFEINTDNINIGDCSIQELVRLSGQRHSILGQARYRFADFMYCKDLGKISNNHLITLRRFAMPVGDDIYSASHMDGAQFPSNNMPGDIGRLISWFDTDDNKLEDIMSYEYDTTWKQLTAKIQQLDSQEDDEARGPVGGIINMLSPSYLRQVGKGTAAGGALKDIMGWMNFTPSNPTYANNDVALGRNYDNNKVYTPRNTIWDNHIYEGRIEFKHEFTLNFSYKLRAYDNINPRNALLDLLGNIMRVTHVHGHFWAGRSEILGPQPNTQGWNKYNNIVDKAVSGGSEVMQSFLRGDTNFLQALSGVFGVLAQTADGVLSSFGLGGAVSAIKDTASEAAQQIANGDVKEGAKTIGNGLKSGAKKTGEMIANWLKNGGAEAIGGLIKNKLGRPSLYAFDSLVPGGNMGFWHVTIGNPKNPIAVFGNLIMTNAKITHSGPLGIDDFPTELRVSCAMKHARPRDITAIEKMYTKGQSAIYLNHNSPFTKIKYKSGQTKESLEIGTDNSADAKLGDDKILKDLDQYKTYINKIDEVSIDENKDENNNITSTTQGYAQNLTAWMGDYNTKRIQSNRDLLRAT